MDAHFWVISISLCVCDDSAWAWVLQIHSVWFSVTQSANFRSEKPIREPKHCVTGNYLEVKDMNMKQSSTLIPLYRSSPIIHDSKRVQSHHHKMPWSCMVSQPRFHWWSRRWWGHRSPKPLPWPQEWWTSLAAQFRRRSDGTMSVLKHARRVLLVFARRFKCEWNR